MFSRSCSWYINPGVHLNYMELEINYASFDRSHLGRGGSSERDLLWITSDNGLTGAKFTMDILVTVPHKMRIESSDSVTIQLTYTSADTHFDLKYRCEESEDVFFLFGYISRVMIALIILFVCGNLTLCCCSCCLCRKWEREHQRAIELSVILRREGIEESVMNAIQELPVRTWTQDGLRNEEVFLDDECPLCLEAYTSEDNLRLLPCNHYFHKVCIDRWFAERRFRPRTCPTCRRNPVETADPAESRVENMDPVQTRGQVLPTSSVGLQVNSQTRIMGEHARRAARLSANAANRVRREGRDVQTPQISLERTYGRTDAQL